MERWSCKHGNTAKRGIVLSLEHNENAPVQHSRTGAFQQEKERRESPQLMMGAAHLNFIQAIYIGPAVLKRNNLPLDLLTVI